MPRLRNAIAKLAWLALVGSAPLPARAEVVLLSDLERIAVTHRPVLSAAAASIRAARFDLEHAEAADGLALALEGKSSIGPGRELVRVKDFEHQGPDDETFLVAGSREIDQSGAWKPRFINELNLELQGNLYDFGRRRAAAKAGRAASKSAEAEEQAAREAIVKNVRLAYLAWLAQQELLAITERAAADAEQRSQRVQALIGEGARPKSEASGARADELLGKLELERARGELRAARLALEHAVGQKLPANAEADRSLLTNAAGAATDTGSPAPSAELRALSLRHEAAQAEAHRLDQADAPLLAGTLAAGLRGQDVRLFPAYTVGLSFAVPLWDGGETDAAASAAKARAEALSFELEQRRVEHNAARERAQLERENAAARLAAAEALLAVANERASEAEQAYGMGAIGIEQLSDARALVRRAQTEVLHEQLARAQAQLELR